MRIYVCKRVYYWSISFLQCYMYSNQRRTIATAENDECGLWWIFAVEGLRVVQSWYTFLKRDVIVLRPMHLAYVEGGLMGPSSVAVNLIRRQLAAALDDRSSAPERSKELFLTFMGPLMVQILIYNFERAITLQLYSFVIFSSNFHDDSWQILTLIPRKYMRHPCIFLLCISVFY